VCGNEEKPVHGSGAAAGALLPGQAAVLGADKRALKVYHTGGSSD